MRFFLVSLLLAGTALAAEPQFPAYRGFVNDFAGVIDSFAASKLENLCRTLEEKTSAEMAIAVVKAVAPLDSKTYAVKLFEKWKIGKKGKDNGLLILLALDERRVEIEVGYGLEGAVNDAAAGEILDKYVVPFFKKGDFGGGLYNGAAALAERIARSAGQELAEEFQPAPTPGVKQDDLSFYLIVGAVLALVFLSLFSSGIASGLMGALMGVVFGFVAAGIIGAVIGAVIGFMLSYSRFTGKGGKVEGWMGGWGGGWGGGEGGGFGGFGGGGSGGGGSGRSW